MDKEYGLYYQEDKVGSVRLSRCGMFYALSCRFRMTERGIFRLIADNGKEKTDLGKCVRYGQALGAEHYLPVKRIGEGQLRFYIVSVRNDGKFIPIDEAQPFQQLDKLLNARFAVQSERKGILLDAAENQEQSTAM